MEYPALFGWPAETMSRARPRTRGHAGGTCLRGGPTGPKRRSARCHRQKVVGQHWTKTAFLRASVDQGSKTHAPLDTAALGTHPQGMDTTAPQPSPATPRRVRRPDLVQHRADLGIALGDVAAEVGVSRQAIGQMETLGATPAVWSRYESGLRRVAERIAERAARVIAATAAALLMTGCGTPDADPVDCSLETLCAQWSADLWLAIVPGSDECMLQLVPWSPDGDDLGEQVCE